MKNNWVSLLALVISIIALMLSYRVIPVDFKDYWGFVLGVLTLFITILIGWQIYNSIEINKKIDRIDAIIQKEIELKIQDYNYVVSALFIQNKGIAHFEANRGEMALELFMESLEYLNKSTNQKYTEGVITYIEAIRNKSMYISFITQDQKYKYITILSECKCEKKTEIMDFIMNLNVKPIKYDDSDNKK